MARAISNSTDAGKYNRPAEIQKRVARVDDGSGGNSAGDSWVTVRSPMILFTEAPNGRGLARAFRYGQLYPEAKYWAEFWYASDVAIDATMTLLLDGVRYQVLGAIDQDKKHIITLLALVEYQAQGSK